MPKRVDYTWLSYSGTARIGLAIILVVVAAAITYAGTRLRRPVLLPRPSQQVKVIIVVGLVLAIVAFLICATSPGRRSPRSGW